jgi:hypothetical protein
MAYVATKKLLAKTDATKADVLNKALQSGAVKSEDCPWVEIDYVYVSVSITGEESYGSLIANLVAKGKKEFVVFTGRHGDIPNMVDNKTKMTIGVFDQAHYDEDVKIKAQCEKEFKKDGITITLVNTVGHEKLHTEWLKKEVVTHKGKSVILAWCYSLFTFVEGDADVLQYKTKVGIEKAKLKSGKEVVTKWAMIPLIAESHNLVEIAKPIATIVKDDFGWVK